MDEVAAESGFRGRVVFGLAVVLLTTVLVGCQREERYYPIAGSVSVPDCGSYPVANTAVKVRGDDGALIGSTTTSLEAVGAPARYCVMTFAVSVPAAGIYQFKIGDHWTPPYSFAEIEGAAWEVVLCTSVVGPSAWRWRTRADCR